MDNIFYSFSSLYHHIMSFTWIHILDAVQFRQRKVSLAAAGTSNPGSAKRARNQDHQRRPPFPLVQRASCDPTWSYPWFRGWWRCRARAGWREKRARTGWWKRQRRQSSCGSLGWDGWCGRGGRAARAQRGWPCTPAAWVPESRLQSLCSGSSGNLRIRNLQSRIWASSNYYLFHPLPFQSKCFLE